MRILACLLFAATTLHSFCQVNETLLYTSKGQLKYDTSLSISINQLNQWRGIEDLLIDKLIQDIKYSAIARENNLSGTLIAVIEVDSAGKLVSVTFKNPIGGGLEKLVELSVRSFQHISSLKSRDTTSNVFYLPLSFNLIIAKDFIQNKNAIPIFGVEHEFIQR